MPLGASRLTLLAFQPSVAAAAVVIRKKYGISANGSVQIDTAQKAFGGSSVLSTGSADTLTFVGSVIPTASDANFTIESYVRFTGTNSRKMLYSQYTTGIGRTSLEIGTDEKASFFCARQSSFQEADRILGDSALSVDTWYHIAVVRQGTTFTMYIDGVAQADTITGHTAGVQDVDFEIFGDDFGSHTDDVHQDEFRVSNRARYTGNFIKPSVPFGNDEDTILLCHFDGTDGSTFFDDDNGAHGRHPVSVETVGGNAQVDTAQYKFGSASALFDGTDDYIDLNFRSNILSNTETIEFWYRPSSVSGVYGIMSQNNQGDGTGMQILQINNEIHAYKQASGALTLGGSGLSANTWHHIAVVNNAGAGALYIDGVSKDTDGSWSGTNTNLDLRIGEGKGISSSLYDGTRYDLNGHLDELRISDTARYTSGFTAPTDAFTNDKYTRLLLHFDGTDASTSFPDDSGNRPAVGLQPNGNVHISTDQSKFGNTSIEFDGTGDYLNIPAYSPLGQEDNSLMELKDDFTLEAWVRLDINNATQGIICGDDTSPYHAFNINGDGKLTWQTPYMVSTTVLSTGTWHHIAYVRDGATARLFVNGSQEVTSTDSQVGNTIFTGPFDNYNVFIGRDAFGSYFNGYMTDVRISRSARYTATFTAPTAPLVNDSDTLLLLHGTGTNNSTLFQDDNGVTRARADVQSINGAAIDTANYQWGGASAEFDDTNDYLELPYEVGNFAGDFTIECWMDTADTLGEFMACQKQGTNEGWGFVTRSLGRLVWTSTTDGSSVSALLSSNSAWSDNTWVHIAVCHNNSTGLTEMFANGARVGSRTEQNPITVTSGGYFRIGGNIYGVSSGLYSDGPRYFGGHLDDVRISNSVRYSGASYTVPTAAFTNDANTVLLLPMNGTDGLTDFTDDNGKETS